MVTNEWLKGGERYYSLNYKKIPNQIHTRNCTVQIDIVLYSVTLIFSLYTIKFVYLSLKEFLLLVFSFPPTTAFYICMLMHAFLCISILSVQQCRAVTFPLKLSSIFDQMALTEVSLTVFISISSCLHSRAFHTVLNSRLSSF